MTRILTFCMQGTTTDVGDETDPLTMLPGTFALDQNYPNPFNPSTVISYSIAPGQLDRTTLSVFNVLGRKVATLVDEVQGPGQYEVTWDGSTDGGERVASGIYFYRLTRGEAAETKKMMLVK
ncbi:T9SS type A sorting domain-containing protein [candidate division GN15 bacterium]|nr:T9SS type A sorting domain-containing protein [candidate division GN15 bacterium]